MADKVKTASEWLKRIQSSGNIEEQWRKSADKIIDIYRDDSKDGTVTNESKTDFNILWSNVQTLTPAIYSNTPNPDVRRRFKDEDPTGREAADILNRGLSFSIDQYDFDEMMEAVVQDYLLPGRGIAKVEYVPVFEDTEERTDVAPDFVGEDGQEGFPDGTEFDENGAFKMVKGEKLVNEEVRCKYQFWKDVRIDNNARRWSDVDWIAFGDWLTEEDLKEQFGEVGLKAAFELNSSENSTERQNSDKQARVWQIWDKESRKVLTVMEGHKKFLEKEDDPLHLEQFFPIPKPLYALKTNNTLVPRPEYAIYQKQAEELNQITRRITALTDALRRRGVYDASMEELQQLSNAGDDVFIPVTDYATKIMEKGGLAGLMAESPIDKIAQVLVGLYNQRAEIKQIIFEITGISDIQRGSSKASETLGAQQIKAQFGSLRIQPRQKAVQRFARDLLRLKAEIIGEMFSKDTLEAIVGHTVSQEAMDLLKSDKNRGFRIDIETDSTISADVSAEQQNRIRFLTSVTGFIEQMAPIVQSGAIPPDVAKNLLMFGVRSFKIPPALEESIMSIGGDNPKDAQLQQKLQQAQQQLKQAQDQALQITTDAEKIVNDSKIAKAELKTEEEKLLRKEDALKFAIVHLQATAEKEGLELSTVVKDAISQLTDATPSNNSTE